MTDKLSEQQYKELKITASNENKKLNIDNLSSVEKEKMAIKHANSKNFDNDETKEIYIANLLIPDDAKFYEIYMRNGKNLKKCAEFFNVPEKIVFTRVFELGKYYIYANKIKNKKGEEKMKEIEIIDTLPFIGEENIVDDGADQAIAKINNLIDSSNSKDIIIDNLNKNIAKLNDELDKTKYLNDEQKDLIDNLNKELKAKESTILDNEKKIDSLNKDLEQINKEKAVLLKYKENYEKIVSFLAKNDINNK